MPRKSKLENEDQMRQIVADSTCLFEVLQKFGLSGYGDNYSTLRKLIDRWNIDTSHFDPAGRRAKALRTEVRKRTVPLDEVLDGQHPEYKGAILSRRLLESDVMENVCGECGQDEIWNGKPLRLQLDHIDGNRHNHKRDNLRFLCPNCHTQTDTWGARNI
jgi:hypothetical protein